MIKILLIRLQNSQVYHQIIFRKMQSCLRRKDCLPMHLSGRDITGKSVEDMVYEAQRKVILDLAGKEPCVIIGRNADFILKDRDDVLECIYSWGYARKNTSYHWLI